MATRMTLPLLGQTMEEGTIIQWFKKEGEKVEKDEPLLEVMTDKANMEVESPESGVLLKIIAQPDDTIPVKGLIAIIGEKGEDIDDLVSSEGEQAPAQAASSAEAATPVGQVAEDGDGASAKPADRPEKEAEAAPSEGSGGKVLASPRARKLAEESGLDLSVLAAKGSGPGGRIIEKDVQKALEAAPAQAAAASAATPLAAKTAADRGVALTGLTGTGPGGKIRREDVEAAAKDLPAAAAPEPVLAPRVNLGQEIPFTGLRKAVSDNLEKSARTVVPVTLTIAVDMSEVVKLREQVKKIYEQKYGVKLSFTDVIVKAAARAIEDFPIVNSSLEGTHIRIHDSVNVNVAVAVPDGLVAPVVRDANLKPLWSISAEVRGLAERARNGKLGGGDLQGGTFTVTNLGGYGIEHFNAIINPPQSAILAVCAIKDQPVVGEGEVQVRPMMNLCLTFDHRVMDGAPAAEYLAHLKQLLEQPYLVMA